MRFNSGIILSTPSPMRDHEAECARNNNITPPRDMGIIQNMAFHSPALPEVPIEQIDIIMRKGDVPLVSMPSSFGYPSHSRVQH